MNSDFELYTNAGTRGENIIFDSSDKVFADWVIKIYKDKNVKFFITNNYTILPVEKFGEFFNVTAKFRIKRSGSCSVNRYRLEDVKKCILNHSSKRAEFRTTEEERILVNADGLSHFDSISNLYSLAHNVMELNDEKAIRFIQDKLTKDYNEISEELKYLINDKYEKVMKAEKIEEML